jgi:hypothetical protein
VGSLAALQEPRAALMTGDVQRDMADGQLVILNTLLDKLEDEIVARLAELAEPKVGRLTFQFASLKLQALEEECSDFTDFIRKNRFEEKRNYDISHKELPERWTDRKFIEIPYLALVQGIAKALRLMKRIDSIHAGPRARYLWKEMRTHRYEPMYPAKVRYMIMPYTWPSAEDRARIIQAELAEGREIWKDMSIKINGKEIIVKTYGEFGALVLGGRIVLLPDPFVELTSIDFPLPDPSPAP